jgi:hypothetical protein
MVTDSGVLSGAVDATQWRSMLDKIDLQSLSADAVAAASHVSHGLSLMRLPCLSLTGHSCLALWLGSLTGHLQQAAHQSEGAGVAGAN